MFVLTVTVICCRILRKRRRSRETTYQKVMELHDEDEPPFMYRNEYRDNAEAEMHALERVQDLPYVPEAYVPEEHVPEEHVPEEHIAEEHTPEAHIAEHIPEEHRT